MEALPSPLAALIAEATHTLQVASVQKQGRLATSISLPPRQLLAASNMEKVGEQVESPRPLPFILPSFPPSLSSILLFSLLLLMKIQLTIKLGRRKKGNFIGAKLRIITQEVEAQNARRTVPTARSQRHSHVYLRQEIVHQDNTLLHYIKFTKDP